MAVLRASKAVSHKGHKTHSDPVGVAVLKGRGVSHDCSMLTVMLCVMSREWVNDAQSLDLSGELPRARS